MKRILAILFWLFSGSIVCLAQQTYYLPQIADGPSGGTTWVTAVAVTNPAAPNTPAVSGTLTFTKDDGTPFNLFLTDSSLKPVIVTNGAVSFQIAGGQTRIYISTGFSPSVTTGYATVTSTATVVVGAIFTELNSAGSITAEAGVAEASPLTQQGTIANQIGADTGIAIANPGTGSSSVTFQLLDLNGNPAVTSVAKTVNAKAHTSFFVSQLFSNIPAGFVGTLRITSTAPVVATALLFNSGGVFATLPVFPLQ